MPVPVRATVGELVGQLRHHLGADLQTVTVHGSLAMGGFRAAVSDIDVLVVAAAPLPPSVRDRLGRALVELSDRAPARGIELSIVTVDALRAFSHPLPYELHVSPAWHDRFRAGTVDLVATGTDPDLAAHLTVALARGLTIWGSPIGTFIGAVPRAAYLDAIIADAQDAATTIGSDPVYAVLNLCRVLAYLAEGRILSKAEGGHWGINHLPPDAALIGAALATYTGHRLDEVWDPDVLAEFALRMLIRIDAGYALGGPFMPGPLDSHRA